MAENCQNVMHIIHITRKLDELIDESHLNCDFIKYQQSICCTVYSHRHSQAHAANYPSNERSNTAKIKK